MSAAVGLRVLRLASALLRPRQAWGFGMQVAVSAAGMALGVGMLASGRGDAAVYLPIVTSIIGYWLPAPRPSSSAGPQDATAREQQSSVGSVYRDDDAKNMEPSKKC